jgi:hypothetical protein
MSNLLRIAVLMGLLHGLAAAPAAAQDWAGKMFEIVEHDFGVVARGSEQHFKFQFKNLYQEDVLISSVRSSCGCTTPSFQRVPIKSLQTGTILASYNTRTMSGARGATLTVTFEKPYPAEVQLNVKGFIRPDVFFQPASVQFGEVNLGSPSEREMSISHSGSANWQIMDVRSLNTYYEVMLPSRRVEAGRVTYQMQVRLTAEAPVGYLNDQLILVTNDEQNKEIRLSIDGRIVSPLSVSPASLLLGALAPGERVTRKLVVRGRQPFRILSIETDGEGMKFSLPEAASKLHVVPLEFVAPSQPGRLVQTIVIATDLAGGTQASCVATAEIATAP